VVIKIIDYKISVLKVVERWHDTLKFLFNLFFHI